MNTKSSIYKKKLIRTNFLEYVWIVLNKFEDENIACIPRIVLDKFEKKISQSQSNERENLSFFLWNFQNVIKFTKYINSPNKVIIIIYG